MPDISAKIVPSLWYVEKADEAAAFYVSIFPDSKIDQADTLPAESPSGPPGSVIVVNFTLAGQAFQAMSAGPLDPFNHAISFTVNCEDQAEVDHYWDALQAGGGHPEQCGWLRDRWGVCWQIVPKQLGQLMMSPDKAQSKRVAEAMMKMVKLDVAGLEAAARG